MSNGWSDKQCWWWLNDQQHECAICAQHGKHIIQCNARQYILQLMLRFIVAASTQRLYMLRSHSSLMCKSIITIASHKPCQQAIPINPTAWISPASVCKARNKSTKPTNMYAKHTAHTSLHTCSSLTCMRWCLSASPLCTLLSYPPDKTPSASNVWAYTVVQY